MTRRLRRVLAHPLHEAPQAVRDGRQAFDNWRGAHRRTVWSDHSSTDRIALVVVNYNTARLLANLVFSLYRVLDRDEFSALVVVDNGSIDDSGSLLGALKEAGLVHHVVDNRRLPYHGPGLNRGVSFLAEHQVNPTFEARWVGAVDSDVVALRPGGLRAASRRLIDDGAVLAGQMRKPNT